MNAAARIAIAAVFGAAIFGALTLFGAADARIATVQELPGDVKSLTDSTWAAFIEVFTAKRDCIGTVSLELVEEVVDGAARYDASTQTIEIEIPTSPRRYPESLAHELGHHLEAVCGVEAEIGAQFLRAQGFGPGDRWSGFEQWHERPSEHFAEAVVDLVLGERVIHADVIEISGEAAAIVERWAQIVSMSD